MKVGDVVVIKTKNHNRQLDGCIGTIIINDNGFWRDPAIETAGVYGLCVMLSDGAVYGFRPEELEVVSEAG